jgi:hypothetical protein
LGFSLRESFSAYILALLLLENKLGTATLDSAGIKALTDAACVRVESKPAVTAARYGRLVLLDQHITHAKRSAP